MKGIGHARKHDVRFTLTAEEKRNAMNLLHCLGSRVRQNPGMRPCINMNELRFVWPYIQSLYEG